MAQHLADIVHEDDVSRQHGYHRARRCNNESLPRPAITDRLLAGHRIPLVPDRLANLSELQPDQLIRRVASSIHLRENHYRVVGASLIDQPARALRQPRQQRYAEQPPRPLHHTRQPPRPAAAELERSVRHARGGQGANVEAVVKEGQAPRALVPWERLGEVCGAGYHGGGGPEADDDSGGAEHGDVL